MIDQSEVDIYREEEKVEWARPEWDQAIAQARVLNGSWNYQADNLRQGITA